MSDQDPTYGDSGDQPTPPPPPPPPPPGSAPTPPGGSYGSAAAGQPADVGVRLGARVIDAILVGIVNAIVTTPIIVGAMFADGPGAGSAFFVSGFGAAAIVASLLSLIITFGYFVLMDTRLGKTVGKMLLNLEVKGTAGGLPTVEESFKRNAWMLLSIVPVIGGLLQLAAAIYIAVTISNSPSNVGWHDEFAGGTRVVRTA